MSEQSPDQGSPDGQPQSPPQPEVKPEQAAPSAPPEPPRPVRQLVDIGEPARPVVTIAFLVLTVAVTIWEFVSYGGQPTTSELARAGGSSVGAVANGAWWKLLTANLLHAHAAHLATNAFVIYLTGRWLEHLVGRWLMVATILWAALLSSAGSLLLDSAAVTIGASGVAFGIIGCALAVDPRARTAVGAMARQLAVLNLVLTFVIPNISIGGHLGGLVAGVAVGALGWSRRPADGHPAGRLRLTSVLVAVAVALPIVALLALGPRLLPDDGRDLRGSVAAPLLARQLAGAELSSGERLDHASCSATSDPAEFDCTVDGEQRDARFSRDDDRWSLAATPG